MDVAVETIVGEEQNLSFDPCFEKSTRCAETHILSLFGLSESFVRVALILLVQSV